MLAAKKGLFVPCLVAFASPLTGPNELRHKTFNSDRCDTAMETNKLG